MDALWHIKNFIFIVESVTNVPLAPAPLALSTPPFPLPGIMTIFKQWICVFVFGLEKVLLIILFFEFEFLKIR